jgi:hypothetical protein
VEDDEDARPVDVLDDIVEAFICEHEDPRHVGSAG